MTPSAKKRPRRKDTRRAGTFRKHNAITQTSRKKGTKR